MKKAAVQGVDLTPKHLTKQEFGKRLYQIMLNRGWSQSELSRHAGLQRAAISTYITGKCLPTPVNLEALAMALNVQAEDLLPNHTEEAIDRDQPAFDMKASASDPSKAWVRMNRLTSFSVAVKIAALLEDYDAAHGSGSGRKAEV